MAGHSQFKNIMYRKGAQDAKRSKLFSKLSKEITVAVKMGGEDAGSNARLRLAIQEARANNMPKDNIERAVKKAFGGDEANYDEMRYEGYGPGGVAIIVEALTDNRNRTAGDVRAAFSKNGGALGETNSVAFMFDRVGAVRYAADKASADAMLEAAIEAGADDCVSDADGHEVICAADALNEVAGALEARFGDAESAKLVWKPQTLTPVTDEDKAATLMKLMDVLDDNDDVQNVYANFDIADEVMERLA